jgi:putative sigma-54 modulation protein
VQVKLSVRHGHLNDDSHKVIREKASKLLHFFERLTLIEVTVDLQQKETKHVEFVVQAEHKHDFVARESHAEVLAAFELALAKIEAQLRRYKEKIQDHRRDPSAGDFASARGPQGPTDE